MDFQNSLPLYSFKQIGKVILLETEPNQERCNRLQQWLNEAQQQGAKTWLLSCDRDEGGPWAGLNDLLNDLVEKIRVNAPDLIIQHDYELVHVLPALRRMLSVRYLDLTDAPLPQERVSYHPADRAFRICHGIINLLSAWYQRSDSFPWIIACDHFDRAGTLVRHFFSELMRRRGHQLNLTLLVATDIGAARTVTSGFVSNCLGQCVRFNLLSQPASPVHDQEITQRVQELSQRVEEDEIEQEIHLPRLIRYLLLCNQQELALKYQVQACSIYATRGFYQDALVYGELAIAQLEHCSSEEVQKYWDVYTKLHKCYVSLHKYEQALQVTELAIAKTDAPESLLRAYNIIGTLYARHLKNRDLIKAEAYLKQGMEEIARSNLPEETKFFKSTIYRRALALVRFHERKINEALELCRSCYKQTINYLGADRHRPHQSLLVYNLFRIYSAVGSYDKAVAYLTEAITLDPNSSELHNERGNLHFKLGHLDDALNDYIKAIKLSPPYPEVWTNLGQCYRLKGKLVEAVDAYSISLDLDPNQSLALVSRAQVFEILGQPNTALADYNAALSLNSKQPPVLANCAALHYDAGRYQKALEYLNRAIALSPETSDLYQNRAIALTALGRFEEAVQDLTTYLRLNPDAGDRSEVEERLLSLQNSN